MTIGSASIAKLYSRDAASSTSGYQCQSSAEAASSGDVLERLGRHIQTYVSIAGHKNEKDVSRQKGGLMSFRCQYYPRVSSRMSLSRAMYALRSAGKIFIRPRWKGEVSLYLRQTRSAQPVFHGRVCAHRRSLLGFAGNERSQSA